jgi:hypothetical protein
MMITIGKAKRIDGPGLPARAKDHIHRLTPFCRWSIDEIKYQLCIIPDCEQGIDDIVAV